MHTHGDGAAPSRAVVGLVLLARAEVGWPLGTQVALQAYHLRRLRREVQRALGEDVAEALRVPVDLLGLGLLGFGFAFGFGFGFGLGLGLGLGVRVGVRG